MMEFCSATSSYISDKMSERAETERDSVHSLSLSWLPFVLSLSYRFRTLSSPAFTPPPISCPTYLSPALGIFRPYHPPFFLTSPFALLPGLFSYFTFLPVLYWVAFVCGLSHTNTSLYFPRRVVLAIYLSLPPILVLFCSSLPRPPATS